MTNLFVAKTFISHSGKRLDWKIECDALTDADWDCLGTMAIEYLLSDDFPRVMPPSYVKGIPRGGLKFAEAINDKMAWSIRNSYTLWVDDVMTTGNSFRDVMKPGDMGLVVFNRGFRQPNIEALWQYTQAR